MKLQMETLYLKQPLNQWPIRLTGPVRFLGVTPNEIVLPDPAPVTEDLDDFPTPQRRPTIRRPPSSTAAPVSTDEFEDEDDEPPPTPIGNV